MSGIHATRLFNYNNLFPTNAHIKKILRGTILRVEATVAYFRQTIFKDLVIVLLEDVFPTRYPPRT